MRYLLDTNALSEPFKQRPSKPYLAWARAVFESQLATSCLAIGELQKGVSLATDSRQQARIKVFVADVMANMDGKILPLDTETCVLWGELFAAAQHSGKKPQPVDSLLAAQAIQHNLTLVTRNVKDFKQFTALNVLCPWN